VAGCAWPANCDVDSRRHVTAEEPTNHRRSESHCRRYDHRLRPSTSALQYEANALGWEWRAGCMALGEELEPVLAADRHAPGLAVRRFSP
jgi:hypothetical protein